METEKARSLSAKRSDGRGLHQDLLASPDRGSPFLQDLGGLNSRADRNRFRGHWVRIKGERGMKMRLSAQLPDHK